MGDEKLLGELAATLPTRRVHPGRAMNITWDRRRKGGEQILVASGRDDLAALLDRASAEHPHLHLQGRPHAKSATLRAGTHGDGSDVDWDAVRFAVEKTAASIDAETAQAIKAERAAAAAAVDADADAARKAAEDAARAAFQHANSIQRVQYEYPWPQYLAARTIGRKGVVIRRLQSQLGCQLDVLEARNMIRITAPSEASLDLAIAGLAAFRDEIKQWDWACRDGHVSATISISDFRPISNRNAYTKHALQDHHNVKLVFHKDTMQMHFTGETNESVSKSVLDVALLCAANHLKVEEVIVYYKREIRMDAASARSFGSHELERLSSSITGCGIVRHEQSLIVYSLSGLHLDVGEAIIRSHLAEL